MTAAGYPVSTSSTSNHTCSMPNTTICFGGDVSLNGGYCSLGGDQLEGVFADIHDYLTQEKVDGLVINLESPLVGNGSENQLKNPRLKTTPSAMEALKVLQPDIAILANNHIYDCLEAGCKNSEEWLLRNRIHAAGVSLNPGTRPNPFRFQKNDVHFSLLCYVAPDTNPSIPSEAGIHLETLSVERVLTDIKKESGSRTVIVSLHWGLERCPHVSPWQRRTARSFAEAGAALVVGHHAHVLQGYEEHGNSLILYGLGNFAFDDVLDTDPPVLWTRNQRHGGLATVCFEKDKTRLAGFRITSINHNLSVSIETDPAWQRIMRKRLAKLRMGPISYLWFWSIYQFFHAIVCPPFAFFFGERKRFFNQLLRVRPHHLLKPFRYARTFVANLLGGKSP